MVQVNTEENPLLSQRFDIRSIPFLVALRDGRTLDTLAGARDRATITAWFRRTCGRH